MSFQDNEPNEHSTHLYPTVFSGPMDITKARSRLGFEPTDPKEAFKARKSIEDLLPTLFCPRG